MLVGTWECWWVLGKAVNKFRVPQNFGIFCTGIELVSISRTTIWHEVSM